MWWNAKTGGSCYKCMWIILIPSYFTFGNVNNCNSFPMFNMVSLRHICKYMHVRSQIYAYISNKTSFIMSCPTVIEKLVWHLFMAQCKWYAWTFNEYVLKSWAECVCIILKCPEGLSTVY